LRKKSIAAAALLAATALLGSGIGAAPATAADTVVVWADDTRGPQLKTFLEKRKFAGKSLTITTFSSKDALDTALRAATASNGPDIVFAPVGEAVVAAKSGKAAPFVLSRTSAGNFSSDSLAYGQYKGRQYGLPLDVDGVAMIWNRKFGPAPTTFADFATRFQAAKAAGRADFGICASDGSWGSLPLITALGGSTWGTKPNGQADPSKVGIDDPTFIANLKRYALNANGKGNGLLRVQGWDTCSPSWLNGKTMALATGSWRIEPTKAAKIKYTVTTVPTLNGQGSTKVLAGFGGVYITNFAKDHGMSLAAKAVIDYLATPAGSAAYATATGRPTPNSAAAARSSGDARAFATALSKTATPQLNNLLGNNAGGSDYYTVLNDVFEKILVKGNKPETVLRKAKTVLRKNFAAGAKE
jgi:arabinogalactan oligomer / maltooligosaccharide transport system substrate-binding protein